MRDYFYLLNNEFLKNIKLKDDESSLNVSSFRFTQDKKLIDEIVNKSDSYKYLNEKEVKILKSFNLSMNNYDDELNLNYIKNSMDKLLKSSNEDILAFCIKNRVQGVFMFDIIKYEGSNFLYINQGKNNISNITLYRDSKFLIRYQEIIKDILSLFITIDDSTVKKIVDFEIKVFESRLSNTDRRDVGTIEYKNPYLLSEDTNDKKYYQFIDGLLGDPDFKYYILWCIILETSLISFGKLNDKVFELIKIIKGIKKKMSKDKKMYHLNNMFLGHLISKEYFINCLTICNFLLNI